MQQILATKPLENVMVSEQGRRSLVVRLTDEYEMCGCKAGDLVAVDIDAPLFEGCFIMVAFQGGLFFSRCILRAGSYCFWFRGQRWPAVRATWGDHAAPVVVGVALGSGRSL